MRIVAFSINTGTCFAYHDFGRDDGGPADEGVLLSSRLFDINRLLLQACSASSDEPDSGSTPDQSALGAAVPRGDGGSTILGMGMRRLNRSKSTAARSRLAVRQWNLDSEQWALEEDVDTDCVLAASVGPQWPPETAVQIARALRDAFVQTHRPQLLAAQQAPRTGAPATSDLAPRKPQLLATSPHTTIPTLWTLQALKLVSQLTLEGLEALLGAGLQPCWLYVVHVESFMGWQLRTHGPGRSSRGSSGAAATAASAGGGGGEDADTVGSRAGSLSKGKKTGLMRRMLERLGSSGGSKTGTKLAAGAVGRGGGAGSASDGGSILWRDDRGSSGGGGGAPWGGGLQGSVQSSTGGGGGARGGVEGRRGEAWEPGPVGQLQHLVLPLEDDEGVQRALAAGVRWDAPSAAATVMQVKPPDGDCTSSHGRGNRPLRGDVEGGGPAMFPELEDVELELEMQLGGDASGVVRQFSVVAIRLQHVLAVTTRLLEDPPAGAGATAHPGGSGSGSDEGRPGSMSRVRHLLRPSLVPLSSLLNGLAHWAGQEEVAAHGLLLRLLE